MITFDEFKKVELRVGRIVEVVNVEGSDKLLKLSIDLGEESPRQILSGISKFYDPAVLMGKQLVIASNLEPRKMMGLESQGMVLACGADKPVLLVPMEETQNGSIVR